MNKWRIYQKVDGDPTDYWQGYLTELKQDNWFKAGGKLAIAIAVVADCHGDDSCFRGDMGAKIAVECAGRRKYT